jgi:hypothetical protein
VLIAQGAEESMTRATESELTEGASVEVSKWEDIEDAVTRLILLRRKLSDAVEAFPLNTLPEDFRKALNKYAYAGGNTGRPRLTQMSQYAAADWVIGQLRNAQRTLITDISNAAIRWIRMKYGEMAKDALGTTGIHGDIVSMFMRNPSEDPIGYDMARDNVIAKIKDASKLYKEVIADYMAMYPKRVMRECVEAVGAVTEAKVAYDLNAFIRPSTQTDAIIKRAITQASAGKTVELGNPVWRFWYDDKRGQWGVSDPSESYPRFFDGTDEAATYFVRSWMKGSSVAESTLEAMLSGIIEEHLGR